MARIRTFIAVELDDAVRVRASTLIDKLRTCGTNVKWVERDKMHLTLKFLGDVDEREVNNVCVTVTKAVSGFGPFSIHCAGASAFPEVARPRTPWLGVGDGAEELCRLQKNVEDALFGLGYPKEARQFHPHLTLGRSKVGGPSLRELSQLIQKLADYDAGISMVDEVIVMSSFLERSGPIYHPLARIQLTAAS
jgi:2'-5' RNA ligase